MLIYKRYRALWTGKRDRSSWPLCDTFGKAEPDRRTLQGKERINQISGRFDLTLDKSFQTGFNGTIDNMECAPWP